LDMIGKTISHYKIIEKLGEGGMGVVYKAQDTRLKRIVALKFLSRELTSDPEAKKRFVQEAQAAALLDHPNICTVYEIDEADDRTFIAMAYIEGQNVKDKIESGPLKLDEALDIAIQVAEGLREAHDKGIVHQDIKSSNILLTSKGQAKIMDFGLAKLSKGKLAGPRDMVVGTAAYMSPEQAHGEAVDQRTDIWSLGAVLYEMISGQLPFKGDYEQAVMYSILNEEPQPLTNLKTDLPKELERIVNKALTKNLDDRYQNASDLLIDLKKLRKEIESRVSKEKPIASKPQPSIAVLPFVNLSADPEQEYFCDGMAEGVINALTHVEDLRVVARTSAFAFKGKQEDIREIGKKLNVETLLEGSVRKVGNRVRIAAQLVNVADGYHLWSEKYDRDIGELCCPEDIFAIQDEISMSIVDKLKVKLLGKEKAKLIKRHTHDIDAYNLYLKGRFFWNKRTEENLKKAIKYFEQAIEKDPLYALAYAGLADSYITLEDYSSIPPKEIYPRAKKVAQKAVEIDDTLAEAHTSLASIADRGWDWEGAEREFKQAIELNPNYATAHHWYAIYLMYMARLDEAIEEIKRARGLDTLSLIINRNVALVFYYARQYSQAIDAVQKTLEMDPSFSLTHATLGRVYLQKSMYEEALAEFQKERELLGVWDQQLESWLGITYAKMGKGGDAQKVLDDLIKRSKQAYLSPCCIALVYFALGEKDQGFKWLNKAYQEHSSCLIEIKVDPGFDSVRSDPRFKALLKKIGLEK